MAKPSMPNLIPVCITGGFILFIMGVILASLIIIGDFHWLVELGLVLVHYLVVAIGGFLWGMIVPMED